MITSYFFAFIPSSFLPSFPIAVPFLFSDSPPVMVLFGSWIPHVNESRLD